MEDLTYVCVSEGKKCLFFGNFGVLCFLETLVLRFALLPYYRRKFLNLHSDFVDYKSFSNEGFRESLLENLKGKLSENSDKNFSNFINTCNTGLDKQLRKKTNSSKIRVMKTKQIT